jgi:16S rRNA (guanine527-N7)-methyltransferase
MPKSVGQFLFLREHFPLISEMQLQQFEQAAALYEEWNAKINVISRKDIEQLPVRHVLHSLAIAKYIRFNPDAVVLDIGTGGGFPGIPLAIMFPETQFILADSIAKKITVVTEIASALKLQNVQPLRTRVEEIKTPLDYVVSRATAPMIDLVAWTRNALQGGQKGSVPNGWVVLKGGDLTEEMMPFRRIVEIQSLSNYFKDEFFGTKSLVYLPRQVL